MNSPYDRPIDVTNVFVLTFGHVMGLIGLGYLFFAEGPRPSIWYLVVTVVLYGLAVTAGYHRYYSHRSYEAHPILRAFFIFFGAGVLEGPVASVVAEDTENIHRGTWVPKHRDHHSFTDTDKDPYNIKLGFWWAHMGWIFRKETTLPVANIRDMKNDTMIHFQEKYYVLLAVLSGIILPTIVGLLLGDVLYGLFVLGFLRLVINWQSTFFVNSLAHIAGIRPYSNATSATNSLLTAFLTLGEGNHADHHMFPRDYRNGLSWYSWDPTKWFIWSLQFVGLTKNLYRTSPELIAAARRVA